jgi:hypothetical protein
MATNASDLTIAELPPWVKPRQILGERVAIVDADKWESDRYGHFAKFTISRADGSLAALTLTWSEQRERTVARVIDMLDDGAEGVEVTLVQLPGKDGKVGAYLWVPLERDHTSDWKLAHRVTRDATRAAAIEQAEQETYRPQAADDNTPYVSEPIRDEAPDVFDRLGAVEDEEPDKAGQPEIPF